MRAKILKTSILALIVAGCTGPIVDVATPTSISIRADARQQGAIEATAVAEKHCATYGKGATLISHNDETDRLIFHCVKQ